MMMKKRAFLTLAILSLFLQIPALPGTSQSVHAASVPADAFRILPYGSDLHGVVLQWDAMDGISEYVVLRSQTLGWAGYATLIEDGVQGSDRIRISSTNGLHPGDEFYMRGSDLYTIQSVLDEHTLQLVYPLSRDYDSSHSYYGTLGFSGAWVKNTSRYAELARVSETGEGVYEWVDSDLPFEQDFFYIIGYRSNSGAMDYSNPVNVKLTPQGLLHDAALGSNGGYAWKVTQHYGETPALIDGDPGTYEIRMQYNNPSLNRPMGSGADSTGFS